MDLNHRPLPYQGSALTGLSYRPADKLSFICRMRRLLDFHQVAKTPHIYHWNPNNGYVQQLQAQTVLLFFGNLIFPAASDGQEGGTFIKIDEADAH